MFVSTQLNLLSKIFTKQICSESILDKLNQEFVNVEATLLRAKVLREFSKQKFTSIIQSAIKRNNPQVIESELAYLFSPFILSNLNQTVIYSTPLTDQVSQILKTYYQVEKTLNLKHMDENALTNLNLFLDLQDNQCSDEEFIFIQLLKALMQAEVSNIFLIIDKHINIDDFAEIEKFFNVRIFLIQPNKLKKVFGENVEKIQGTLDMQQLLFKRKDEFHIFLSRYFSEMNAEILCLLEMYDYGVAIDLVEDMFYSEHIYEKLSVYSEYMQTKLQGKSSIT